MSKSIRRRRTAAWSTSPESDWLTGTGTTLQTQPTAAWSSRTTNPSSGFKAAANEVR